MSRLFVCAIVLGSSVEDKPDWSDYAGSARWAVSHATWGVLATESVRLNGTAFGNPSSIADACGDGTPYFYVSLLDESQQNLNQNDACSLTLSEASIDCQTLALDPEDPRCIRLSLTGNMVNVTDADEFSMAKSGLFDLHPAMASWPSDHNWMIQKLNISDIWLIDFFGGASNVPVTNYTKAVAPTDVTVVNATHKPSHKKPDFLRKAASGRWLLHESTWATIATTSLHLQGRPFGNIISVSDGHIENSSGIPYMYVSNLDTSQQDLQVNSHATLTFSEASVDCADLSRDPEDPRCIRLSLTGVINNVILPDEVAFAQANLFEDHPEMKTWPTSHDFHFVKMDIEDIWLINMFGGAANIALDDWNKARPYLVEV